MPTICGFSRLAALALVPSAVLVACNGNSVAASGDGNTTPPPTGEVRVETVVTGLDTPWDLAWGPDAAIWVSERGGSISRVDPASGQRTRVGQLSVTESGESGLMGITFHPDFSSQPFVYAVHSYSSGGIKNRVVRMRYAAGSLGAPETLLDNIPGGGIHDGSRLVIGPDRFLYVSTGDAGSAQLAQDRTSLAGKILRLTLNGQPAPGNPFNSAIYSFGHRNPQGLVFHPSSGALYNTEHGPGDNDEVNLIVAGRNYGWPDVRGLCDGDAGSGERTFCQANNVVEPLAAWSPTIALAGADIYNADKIDGWRGSLLFTTLKDEALWRLTLSGDGTRVTAREALYRGTYGRLRDVLVAPNGDVYFATSNRDGRGSPASNDDRILRITR